MVVGEWHNVLGDWSVVVGEWHNVLGDWSVVVGEWHNVLGHMNHSLDACSC